MSTIESINRSAWIRPRTLRYFESFQGWTDQGEAAAVAAVTERIRGKRLLDIGVGAGRTVPIMRSISNDYHAVDFLAPMVDICQRRFPEVMIEQGDARNMTMFDDMSFDFAMFSFNGLDAVGDDDRALVLREVRRVLTPGGIFLFSTLNDDGPSRNDRPWRMHLRLSDLRHPRQLARRIGGLPLDVRNHLRHRNSELIGDGWALRNINAHHFALVAHFTSLSHQINELEQAGFEVETVFENHAGDVIHAGDDTSKVWWFHIIATTKAEQLPRGGPFDEFGTVTVR